MQEKLKYPSIFEKLMNQNNLTLSLSVYLNFHHYQISDKKLISLVEKSRIFKKRKNEDIICGSILSFN